MPEVEDELWSSLNTPDRNFKILNSSEGSIDDQPTEINDELASIQTPMRNKITTHPSIALMESGLKTGSPVESEKLALR
jgi:hypothetical protein